MITGRLGTHLGMVSTQRRNFIWEAVFKGKNLKGVAIVGFYNT
jgi:hypothetical protein